MTSPLTMSMVLREIANHFAREINLAMADRLNRRADELERASEAATTESAEELQLSKRHIVMVLSELAQIADDWREEHFARLLRERADELERESGSGRVEPDRKAGSPEAAQATEGRVAPQSAPERVAPIAQTPVVAVKEGTSGGRWIEAYRQDDETAVLIGPCPECKRIISVSADRTALLDALAADRAARPVTDKMVEAAADAHYPHTDWRKWSGGDSERLRASMRRLLEASERARR